MKLKVKIDHLYPDFSTYFIIFRVATNKGFPIWRDDGWLFFCESFLKKKKINSESYSAILY